MIQIGGSTPSGEPLGLLTDCHRRIEAALASLVTVVEGSAVLDEPRRAALGRAHGFFLNMAPKHTEDEELSLFPRLRAKGIRWPELEALEQEHQEAHALHEAVDQATAHWLAEGALEPREHEQLAQRVARLAALYARHIRVEDDIVFPRAKASLTADEQEAVRREMVARRAVQIAPLPEGQLKGG